MILTDQQVSPIETGIRKKIDFGAGDTVRVYQKITEKDKTRVQVFEGIVIARKHGTEPGATFTVRRVGTDGIAVEKIFPLYTPMIDRIQVTRKAKTRRAKLYFLRGRTPKQLREKLRKALSLPKEEIVKKTESKQERQSKGVQEEQKEEEKLQKKETSKQEKKETPETKSQAQKSNNYPASN